MFAIKDSFVVGILYLSAIIGAGFATGREIMTFFGCHGYAGFIGLAIACFLIIFCKISVFDLHLGLRSAIICGY